MKNALKMLKQVKLNSLYCWSITCGGDHAVVKDSPFILKFILKLLTKLSASVCLMMDA